MSHLAIIKDTRKLYEPHQNHEPHVGLEFLDRDLRPAREFLPSHTLQSKRVALLNDVRS